MKVNGLVGNPRKDNKMEENKTQIRIIKPNITHQGIGGRRIVIDEKVTETLTNEEVWKLSSQGNPACYNFCKRRRDFNRNFPYKLYYGKVDNLGYVVAEDELIEER